MERLRPTYKKKIYENWNFFHRRNIRLWSQSGVYVYAIPEMPVLEIVVYSCVGQISYLEDDNHFKVQQSLHLIYSLSPFEIISASTDYLEVRFIEEIDFEKAKIVQDILIEINSEISNDSCFEIYGTDLVKFEEIGTVVAKAILKNSGFWLH